MKRISIPILLLVTFSFSFAQSPTVFRRLDLTGIGSYQTPEDYNAWAGAKFSYPLIGSKGSFDLNFGLTGKFVIDFTKIELGRTIYVLTYGNLGIPQTKQNVYSAVASQEDGIVFGVQGYTIFGKIYKQALTAIVGTSAKLNSLGSTKVYSYRFGAGLETSFAGEGLPLILSISPAYTLVNDKAKFVAVQSESAAKGFWTADVYIILPIVNKLGLLVQSAFMENLPPAFRAGVVLSAGL